MIPRAFLSCRILIGMRVLALDTTTKAPSVAFVEDARIVLEHVGDSSRTHAEQLPGDLLDVMEAASVSLATVDLFAVAAGPGSFTGLRIGIATIQGLALVTSRRIVPISALEALAQVGSKEVAPGTLVAAWIDARRHDVFSALYRVTDRPLFSSGRLAEIDPPAVGDPRSIVSRWAAFGHPAVFAGDGAVRYETLLDPAARAMPVYPLAGVVGLLAWERAQAGETVVPAGVQPLYIRRPDAEVARDRNSLDKAASHGELADRTLRLGS